jgi:hypothetical protein
MGRDVEHVLRHEHLIAELDCSERPDATEIEARMADALQKECENVRQALEREV